MREKLVVVILQAKVAPSHIGATHLLCSEKRDRGSSDCIALLSEIKKNNKNNKTRQTIYKQMSA